MSNRALTKSVIVGALMPEDIANLRSWEGVMPIDNEHLQMIGATALGGEVELYGIRIQDDESEEKRASEYVVLSGNDIGTYLRNDQRVLRRHGLPETGIQNVYDDLNESQKAGGIIAINPASLAEVGSKATSVSNDGVPTYNVGNNEVQRSRKRRRVEKLFSLPGQEQLLNKSVAERMKVTKSSLDDAESARQSSSPETKNLIAAYAEGRADTSNEVAVLLRYDNELRVALGQHLLKLIDEQPELPYRMSNTFNKYNKSINHSGYDYLGDISSKEAAALIALAMLDGTYKADPTDPIELDAHGVALQGQHRYVAYKILCAPHEKYTPVIPS